MADTLKFGPEWLRQLSGGNSVGTPPPSPAPGFGKYKLADYRYGREEMLSLYTRKEEVPEELQQYTAIMADKAQDPLAFQNLSEEEQQIMAQSVNSQAVLRMMGRGVPSMRGRGVGNDRGRGRGRGRGDGYMQRGLSYEEVEGGGFGRPRQRPDGSWDEGDPKSYQRSSYTNRYADPTQTNKIYQRSLSSENWRDREEDEDGGDWRRAGSKWNNSRGSWRDGTQQRGFEYDRSHPLQRGGFSRQYTRQRSGENWDEEDLPEWSMDGDPDELGTFDASGAFVSPKRGHRKEEWEIEEEKFEKSPRTASPSLSDNKMEKIKEEKHDSSGTKDINGNRMKKHGESESRDKNEQSQKQLPLPKKNSAQNNLSKTPNETMKLEKPAEFPRPSPSPVAKTKKSPQKLAQPVDNAANKDANKQVEQNKNNATKAVKQEVRVVKQSAESASSKNTTKVPKENKETENKSTNKRREKLKSEAEALDQLQETVEHMVAGITVLEDEDDAEVSNTKHAAALPPEHEHYNKWFYRDPQGDLQGPFKSNEMAEWFSAGYFTMNLTVRRGCDEQFSPLGELIKKWGRVPFLPGPSPPPCMNSTSPDVSQQQQKDHLQAMQQQMLIQQQLVQQQVLMRHLQLQQMQLVMSQLQENEQFKSLPPLQQQQLAMQMMLKQGTPTIPPQLSQQKLSPRSSEAPTTSTSIHPTFNRSFSTPNTSQGQNVPASIWDIDPGTTTMPAGGITAAELESQLKEKEQQEVERKYQERMEREKEALRKEQEEIQRQKEEIERERLEIDRRKQEELTKIEDERLRAEEEKRKLEEERRRHLEEKKMEDEERMRTMEEEMRRLETERLNEIQRQIEMQEQNLQRIKEQDQQDQEKQKQHDIQRREQEDSLRKQQQDALRKLQQEQLANMQLPSHAQWASSLGPSPTGRSLVDIQQQEEIERLERDEIQRKQLEVQRQQMIALQQQQKSWTSSVSPQPGTKSLLEIQQEQARQLDRERQKREENHQIVAKNLSLGAASVWGSSPPQSNWANEGAWGSMKNNTQGTVISNNINNPLGFWDDAIITSGPVKKQSQKPSKQQTSEFPALIGDNPNTAKVAASAQSKAKPSKSKKEEEAVQRLFQTSPQEDDFTLWCKKQLNNMATSVDIPTFIAFLQEVESPYEVHDYVRSYLGENRATEDFAKAFLEKRSQFRSKSKPVVEEDSIWGPALAITPRELRQPNQSMVNDDGQKGKANKKKKGRMMRMDASILGFTVHAAPDRIVGEIDSLETTPR